MLPPLIEQLCVAGVNNPVGLDVNETEVSPEFQPEPVTVTRVPVGPEEDESETNATPTLKLALTEGPGTTLAGFFKMTWYTPAGRLDPTTKVPDNTPLALTVQAGEVTNPAGAELKSVGQVADEIEPAYPEPDMVTAVPLPPPKGDTNNVDVTSNWALTSSP
jgi:hypothetical protein